MSSLVLRLPLYSVWCPRVSIYQEKPVCLALRGLLFFFCPTSSTTMKQYEISLSISVLLFSTQMPLSVLSSPSNFMQVPCCISSLLFTHWQLLNTVMSIGSFPVQWSENFFNQPPLSCLAKSQVLRKIPFFF